MAHRKKAIFFNYKCLLKDVAAPAISEPAGEIMDDGSDQPGSPLFYSFLLIMEKKLQLATVEEFVR